MELKTESSKFEIANYIQWIESPSSLSKMACRLRNITRVEPINVLNHTSESGQKDIFQQQLVLLGQTVITVSEKISNCAG